VFVACASAGVVAFLVAYALAAPTVDLTATVGAPVPQPGPSAVVHGRVLEVDGSALDDAHIEVRRENRIIASAASDRAGRFRIALPGGCAAYEISLRATAQGDAVETASRARLCPGDALPVAARVVTQGHYLWVPGPR
jgi:hypothetical protein